ncbi:hypothetical protein [Cecembia rubra]|uniref:Lipoprotein n=1 Tax=Cecembia rubra TaxID=1485585 RepID=A0A2P8E8C0_9BACT|nr:hypothetical protein [Cecembia rubra]PSL05701.1 hypothetical protein CLV48_103216 [Cecembia rubra]
MRRWLFFAMGFAFSCSLVEKEDLENITPKPFDERETLIVLSERLAYLDAERKELVDGQVKYLFLLRLFDAEDNMILSPNNEELICEFIGKYVGYGYGTRGPEVCGLSYYSSFRNFGQRSLRSSLHVVVSGDIKTTDPLDELTGLPFDLKDLKKLENCHIAWEKKASGPGFEDTIWRFVGFLNERDEIYSTPSCEDQYVTLSFRKDRQDGDPLFISLGDPDARYFELSGAVWVSKRPGDGVKLYSRLNSNQLVIFSGIIPLTSHPGPSNRDRDNFITNSLNSLHKYDSLNAILHVKDTVDFSIEGNTLRIWNQKTGIQALFFSE